MKIGKLRFILTVIYISLLYTIFTTHASGAIIDNGIYTTDTATGLDWLDVTKTFNESYNSVTNQLANNGQLAGWTFATITQLDNLIYDASGILPQNHELSATLSPNLLSLLSSLGLSCPIGTACDLFGITADNGYLPIYGSVQRYSTLLIESNGAVVYGGDWGYDTLDFTGPNLGSFLVKSQSANISTVPAPNCSLLIVIVLFGLFINKNKYGETMRGQV